MRLLITGSQTWDDSGYIWRILDEAYRTSLGIALHHGACRKGADEIADQWAIRREQQGRSVLIQRHPAKWRTDSGVYDPAAGFRRNAEMVQAFAPWGGKCLAFIAPCDKPKCTKSQPHGSHGATHCAQIAESAGLEVVRYRWEDR